MSRGAQASTRGAKARADASFSRIIRSRGACEKCGKRQNLQCAHIISRRYSNTRCDESNAFALCAGCHMWFTDHPVAFAEFVIEKIGRTEYERLFRLAQQTGKVDWHQVAAALKEREKGLAA